MATDTVRDKFQKAGVPDNNADIYSPTPIGGPVVVPEDERVVHYSIADGVPNDV